MEKIVIIGNGISGVTVARHIRKNSDKDLLIISGETEHFFSRTALMYVFMGHMRYRDIKPYEDYFWEKNRIELKFDFVEFVDTDSKSLTMKSGDKVIYDKLILAVGSKSNKFGWPGQDLKGAQGLYSYQDLQLLEENVKDAKHAVVIGGGLIGIEFAEMMISRGIEVTLLEIDDKFWGNILPDEEELMLRKYIESHHVSLKLGTVLDKLISDENGRVKAIKTKTGEVIECQIVGLTPGVSPNIDFLKSSNIETERGIKINKYFETNIKDVYAIGDCAQFDEGVNGRRNLEQVWYTGRIMGETLAQTICGNRLAYNPGPWFNSAKFFDIEYQTYGWVFANRRDFEAHYYWQHSTKNIAMHFVWDKNTGEFIGVNSFGVRLRHELFDKWLTDKVSIDVIMSNLRTANFDPEFFRVYEKDIIDGFNLQTRKNIKLKPKSWWLNLLNKGA